MFGGMLGWLGIFSSPEEIEREQELIRLHCKAKAELAREQYKADVQERRELMDKIDRILSAVETK